MNKKVQIGIGIVAVVSIGLGGVCFIAKSNLEKRMLAVDAQIIHFQKSLPQNVIFEKVQSESNIFESSGKYVLKYNDNVNNTNNGQITFDYKATHGYKAWFGGDIQFVVNGKLDGEVVKTYQILTDKQPGLIFKVEGLVKKNGGLITKNTTGDFSFVVPKPVHSTELAAIEEQEQNKENIPTGMLVNVKGNTGIFTYDPTTGTVVNKGNNTSVVAQDLEDPTDKIVADNIEISYQSTVKDFDLGVFKLSAGSISNGTDFVKAEGFEIMASVEEKNNKHNIKFSSKADKLNILNQQNSSFEFGYSINGIDKRMTELYKKVAHTYAAAQELNEKDAKEARQILMDNIQSGVSFSIDKIKFKNDKTLVDFSGQYEIVPTQKGQQFSFLTQSKFGANVNVEGQFAIMANSFFGSLLGSNLSSDPSENKFKLNITFENEALKLNESNVSPEVNEYISSALKALDVNLQQLNIE